MERYAIRVRVYSEPDKNGNMSEFWMSGKRGKKFSLSGIDNRKVYESISWARKAFLSVTQSFTGTSDAVEVTMVSVN